MNSKFTEKLLKWYHENPRELVWKSDEDAYSIWLSEIIMQQTRASYGAKYYIKFKQLFPTVFALANADFQTVIKAWEGLGYYSRARNLYATAQLIAHERNGQFPSTYEGLLQLKGVGPYTAAAVGSFAFQIPKAAIDGNAYRVLARYFGIQTPIDSYAGKKEFQQLGDKLIDPAQPGNFNQAMMNFGATVCTATSPNCLLCPLSDDCIALSNQLMNDLPVKEKKIRIKKRFFNSYFIVDKEFTWIKERSKGDIWQNLYELPSIEVPKKNKLADQLNNFESHFNVVEHSVGQQVEYQQQLTHQLIHVSCVTIKLENEISLNGFKRLKIKDLANYAFPKVYREILKNILT